MGVGLPDGVVGMQDACIRAVWTGHCLGFGHVVQHAMDCRLEWVACRGMLGAACYGLPGTVEEGTVWRGVGRYWVAESWHGLPYGLLHDADFCLAGPETVGLPPVHWGHGRDGLRRAANGVRGAYTRSHHFGSLTDSTQRRVRVQCALDTAQRVISTL